MTGETLEAAQPPSSADDQPVSIFIHLRPRPGREDDCLQWIRGIAAACQQFPGHLGSNILQPADKHGGEFVVIYRFDRLDNLRSWEDSQERKQWHELSNRLFENELQQQKLVGLETLVHLARRTATCPL
jgi:antibiotic biosynthesis monooxygenase (ABM) superfamily enzyme